MATRPGVEDGQCADLSRLSSAINERRERRRGLAGWREAVNSITFGANHGAHPGLRATGKEGRRGDTAPLAHREGVPGSTGCDEEVRPWPRVAPNDRHGAIGAEAHHGGIEARGG